VKPRKVEDRERREFKKRIDAAKDQIAQQIYVEKYLKDKLTTAPSRRVRQVQEGERGKDELRARQILVKTGTKPSRSSGPRRRGEVRGLRQVALTGPSAQNGGEIPGYFIKEEMVPEISDAAFALKSGEYTKTPVKSQFAFTSSRSRQALARGARHQGSRRRDPQQLGQEPSARSPGNSAPRPTSRFSTPGRQARGGSDEED